MSQTEEKVRDYARGIDVPDNRSVDWKSVAGSGISFGYVIAARGLAPDRQFPGNWNGMLSARVLRGACLSFHPLTDPAEQAKQFTDILQEEPGELPPAVRLKGMLTHTGLNAWDGLARAQRLAAIMNCMSAVASASAKPPVIFTNAWFLRDLGHPAELGTFDLWIADYSGDSPSLPSGWKKWSFWRYAESSDIPGVRGRAALDYFNGTEAELRAYARAAPQPAAVEAEEDEASSPAETAEAVDDAEQKETPETPEPETLPEQPRAARGKGKQAKREG